MNPQEILQVREHAPELLFALTELTNAPIFDNTNIDDMGGLDTMTKQALIGANTALRNATNPYLPFEKDVITPRI